MSKLRRNRQNKISRNKVSIVKLSMTVVELYFVIIRSPNYCSDSVLPGPRSRKRLFKARLQRKKPCVCDYFLLSLFRSALQDPDVLLVHHRFAFHMEREAIINMEQVSQSGPHEPVVQPCTGDHNNFLH